jgi:hypothetical protein
MEGTTINLITEGQFAAWYLGDELVDLGDFIDNLRTFRK